LSRRFSKPIHVSREEDAKLRLVCAGWDDVRVVQPEGRGQARSPRQGNCRSRASNRALFALVFDPPLAFTWGWETQDEALALLPPGASLVEFELEPKDAGTLVHRMRCRHDERAGENLDFGVRFQMYQRDCLAR
jgi:hypothetical protein